MHSDRPTDAAGATALWGSCRRRGTLLLILALLIAIAWIASDTIRVWRTLERRREVIPIAVKYATTRQLRQIRPGMDKEQVVRLLGEPGRRCARSFVSVPHAHEEGTAYGLVVFGEAWEYCWTYGDRPGTINGTACTYAVVVFFGEDGRVSAVSGPEKPLPLLFWLVRYLTERASDDAP